MNTVTLVHPDRLDPSILPENGPVGSIVPFTAFAEVESLSKKGERAWNVRDSFAGRRITPERMILVAAGILPPPPRSLDMEVAIDQAGIDRSQIMFEIVQGDVNFREAEDTEDFEAQQTTSVDRIKTIEGYWVAYWPIQEGQQVSTADLMFQRVL